MKHVLTRFHRQHVEQHTQTDRAPLPRQFRHVHRAEVTRRYARVRVHPNVLAQSTLLRAPTAPSHR
eukprot:1768160-Pyramimonas_sp.AAC.1